MTRDPSLRAAILPALVVGGLLLGGLHVASTVASQPGPDALVVGSLTYAVTGAEQVRGLTDHDLGGMSHGVQSLVTDDKTLLTVTLLVSAGSAGARYDVSSLRAYAAGSSVPIAPVGTTLPSGQLGAHGSVEGAVSFVVRRDGSALVLRAPGSRREIPLLTVDTAPTVPAGRDHPSLAPSPGRPSP